MNESANMDLVGIIKTQWYTQWILTSALRASTQTRTRELDLMHTFLSTFEAPLWDGKLPLRVGEPAGGSLTADEYKFAATTAWPITVSHFILYGIHYIHHAIQIPIIWDMFIEEAESDQKTSIKSFAKRQDQFIKDYEAWKAHREAPQGSAGVKRGRSKKSTKDDKEPKPPKPPKVRMQRDEPVNFLRLQPLSRSSVVVLSSWICSLVRRHCFKSTYSSTKGYDLALNALSNLIIC